MPAHYSTSDRLLRSALVGGTVCAGGTKAAVRGHHVVAVRFEDVERSALLAAPFGILRDHVLCHPSFPSHCSVLTDSRPKAT